MRKVGSKPSAKVAATPKRGDAPASPTAAAGSPIGFIPRGRRSPSPQENARAMKAEEARRAKEEEERAAAEAAQRQAEEEAEARRLAEEEERRNRRPDSPPPTPMQVAVATFMWLRDRASAAGADVQPCADRKFVILPAATVDKLFEGQLLLQIANGYLPRSDEQRTLRGAASLATSSTAGRSGANISSTNVTSSNSFQAVSSMATTASTRGPKAHSALAAIKSPSPPPDAAAAPSPAKAGGPRGTEEELEPVVPKWKPGKFPRMEARYAAWNSIRGVFKRLGVAVSPGLLHEIADTRDPDSLRSAIEGLHQAVRKADNLRRDYSKSLVDEAAAPTPTHAKALHKAPPPSHTELVDRKLLKPVTLPPLKKPAAAEDHLDVAQPPQRTMSATAAPASQAPVGDDPLSSDDEQPTTVQPVLPSTASIRETRPAAIDASTQTPGRCVIVYDDPADDPNLAGQTAANPPADASQRPEPTGELKDDAADAQDDEVANVTAAEAPAGEGKEETITAETNQSTEPAPTGETTAPAAGTTSDRVAPTKEDAAPAEDKSPTPAPETAQDTTATPTDVNSGGAAPAESTPEEGGEPGAGSNAADAAPEPDVAAASNDEQAEGTTTTTPGETSAPAGAE